MTKEFIDTLSDDQKLFAYEIGLSFFSILSAICLSGWSTARGCVRYFHTNNSPLLDFMRWCVDSKNTYGANPESILKALSFNPHNAVLNLPYIDLFSKKENAQ